MNNYDKLLEATANERAALLSQPVLAEVMNGDIGLGMYHQFLANAFHHVRYTVPLMLLTGARLEARQSWLNR